MSQREIFIWEKEKEILIPYFNLWTNSDKRQPPRVMWWRRVRVSILGARDLEGRTE